MTREGGRGGKKGEVGGLVVKYECISRFFSSSNAGACCEFECAAELRS